MTSIGLNANKLLADFLSGKKVTTLLLMTINKLVRAKKQYGYVKMVIVKDTELGHQEVLISAEADGVIGFEMYHTDVEKLINMLHVPESIVKHYARSDVKAAREAAEKKATENDAAQ